MVQKFKITSYAFILFLFGLTLTGGSEVFALDSGARYQECKAIYEGQVLTAKSSAIRAQIVCFDDLAASLINHTKKYEDASLNGRVHTADAGCDDAAVVPGVHTQHSPDGDRQADAITPTASQPPVMHRDVRSTPTHQAEPGQ